MRYKPNLEAPDPFEALDIARHFKLKHPPIQILGHDIPSDPDYEPNCGFFGYGEAAILHLIARIVGGTWVDIGSRFGWTTAHLLAANCPVIAVDTCYANEQYEARFLENMRALPGTQQLWLKYAGTAQALAAEPWIEPQDGFVIDGNHDDPEPLNDARACLRIAKEGCAIVLHDLYGRPIQDAVAFLMAEGFLARVYWTPNGMALCWRGLPDFVPPFHVPDPALDSIDVRRRITGFDLGDCV